MIQFNLLPDVKLEYIKTRRTKRLVILISLVAAGISLTAFAVMFISVPFAQKKHIKDLTADIAKQESTLKSTGDLDKILTIQNQLTSLPQLHEDKPITSRIFPYIQQLTPVGANISKVELDVLNSSLVISGSTDQLSTANKYADTLKFATFTTSEIAEGKPFTNVVTVLSRDDILATFSISCNFDPALFSNKEAPKLNVPKIISTRSETEKPEAVFKENTTTTEGTR